MTESQYALYYPTIEFQDFSWLWAASLIWDRIYKIVPDSYEPDDVDNVKALQEGGEIGMPIRPGSYAREIADDFIKGLHSGKWQAAALEFDVPADFPAYARLHHDKVDVALREMIVAKGKGASHGDWLYVPTNFEALYMTYLANAIADKNNLQLVSDSAAAWTGSTFFQYDGALEDYPQDSCQGALAALIIRDFIPRNLTDLTPKQILAFRETHRDERRRFLKSIKDAARGISACEDPQVVNDLIEDLKKDITSSIQEYKKSTGMLKVVGWTGMKSVTFPVLTRVIGSFMSIDPSILNVLSDVGIGLGLVSGISDLKQKQRKLLRECDYSYLVHLRREWKNCYGGDDYNYFLCRQMEEFIND
jgi:hypothetical protein